MALALRILWTVRSAVTSSSNIVVADIARGSVCLVGGVTHHVRTFVLVEVVFGPESCALDCAIVAGRGDTVGADVRH
jgi:hypothetical protein